MYSCGYSSRIRRYIPLLYILEIYAVYCCGGINYSRNYSYKKMLMEGTYYESSSYEKSESLCLVLPSYLWNKGKPFLRKYVIVCPVNVIVCPKEMC